MPCWAVVDERAWHVVVVGRRVADPDHPLGDWHLARALSARHHVVYVEPGRGRSPGARREVDGVHVVRPSTPPGLWYAPTRAVARILSGRAVRPLGRPLVVIVCDPVRGTPLGIKPNAVVYWQSDLLGVAPSTQRQEVFAARHSRLLACADVVTGVSQPLVDAACDAGAKATLVPNGCWPEAFGQAATPPPELAGAGTVIGFAGGVSRRVDLDLLARLADARPDWTIALVGDVVTTVPNLPNLHAFGPRPYRDLPAWLQRFDVGLIPYHLEPFNLHSCPLKLFEYLAAGTPVVGTALPALEGFGPAVRTAAPDGFVDAVDTMVRTSPGRAACRAEAGRHSWPERAAAIEALVEAVLDRGARGTGTGRR